ncbi:MULTISPECIES: hypothetical protein [Roseivirga]|uniref:Lipoprotein n=1 Tax=Roseivirga thermotolerans TaxID=1758176 RepID=A0ABQ3IC21_9BACT|nr:MULTISPECIES: hypothetical protein [Roseivirga]GHE69424.1 hypothetical protein GCM10011340_26740 [Roseivirga thermotolerans]|tara:strand:+ start:5081 stop:5635 length:555 start_codon:yes stop_codon:yes gene_type:complete
MELFVNRYWLISLLVLPVLGACSDSQIIDYGEFEIEVPLDWKTVSIQGIDSDVGGLITSEGDTLIYDLGWYTFDPEEEDVEFQYNLVYLEGLKANEEVDIDSLYERRIDIKHSYETAEIDCFKAKLVMPLDSLGLFTGVFIDSLSVSDGGVTKFGFYGTDLDKRIQQEFISAIRSISFKNFCKK